MKKEIDYADFLGEPSTPKSHVLFALTRPESLAVGFIDPAFVKLC